MLKYGIIKNIQDSHSDMGLLNTFSASEAVDIGSVRQVAQINENILVKYNKDL